jgi:hypothetical protein
MINPPPNPDLGNCHCLPAVGRRGNRINPTFFGEIATHLSGARNDGLRKGFCPLNRNLGPPKETALINFTEKACRSEKNDDPPDQQNHYI